MAFVNLQANVGGVALDNLRSENISYNVIDLADKLRIFVEQGSNMNVLAKSDIFPRVRIKKY